MLRVKISAATLAALALFTSFAAADQVIYGVHRQMLDAGVAIPVGAACVHDPVWDRVVVWGGVGGYRQYVRTFELVGNYWSWNDLSGLPTPVARIGASAIYRPVNHTMVVFGGRDSAQVPAATNDVSFLNLTGFTPSWSFPSPAGVAPPVRWGHSAVYDPFGDAMYVIGGITPAGTTLNDVWKLSFSPTLQWTQVTPAGPAFPTRWGAGSVFDAAFQRVIVFGGVSSPTNQGGFRSDLWALQLTPSPTWVQLPSGPLPFGRAQPTCAYDSNGQRMFMVGGTQAGTIAGLEETWELSLGPVPAWTNRTATSGIAPNGGYDGFAFVDHSRGRLFFMGGAPYRLVGPGGIPRPGLAGVLPLAPASSVWDTIPGAATPLEHYGPAMLYDPTNQSVVTIGAQRALSSVDLVGGHSRGRARNVWKLSNLATFPAWDPLPGLPILPGFGRPMAMLDAPLHRAIWLENGFIPFSLDLDSGTSWTILPFDATSLPAPVGNDLISAYDREQRRMWIYSSENELGVPVGTIWRMDVKNTDVHFSKLIPTNAPPRLSSPGAAYDPYRNALTIYGTSYITGLAELWAFDFYDNTWQQLPSGEPPSKPVDWPNLTFSEPGNGFILTGGGARPCFYQLGADHWVALDEPGMSRADERWGNGAFWDPIGQRLVTFAGSRMWGHYTGGVGDLWSLTYQVCSTPGYACLSGDVTVDVGDNTTLSFCPEAPFPNTIQWFHGVPPSGTPVVDDQHYSGANTDHLTITDIEAQHAGTYYAVLTDGCGVTQTSNIVVTVFEPFAFGPPSHQDALGAPSEPASADFDGDGHLDAAWTTEEGGLYVATGNGAGELASPTTVHEFGAVGRPLARDFDADGRADLMVPETSAGSITFFKGQGGLEFSGARYRTVDEPTVLAWGRTSVAPSGAAPAGGARDHVLAGQRRMIAVAGAHGGLAIHIATLEAPGVLTIPETFTDLYPSQKVRDVRMADFGNDGFDDVAVLFENSKDMEVWLDRGYGDLVGPLHYEAQAQAAAFAIGDVDGDGNLDAVVVSDGNSIEWFRGSASGEFEGPVAISTVWLVPTHVAIADFDGNGKSDVVFANEGEGQFGVLEVGDGGGWLPPRFFASNSGARGMMAGDFLEDGRPDLLIGTSDNSLVLVPTIDGRGPLDVPGGAKSVALGRIVVAPNPFRAMTALSFRAEGTGNVSAEILDVSGRRVRSWRLATLTPGDQRLEWDGRDDAGQPASPGIYFARIATGARVMTTRIARMR